jgi:hypothetical protein
VILWTVKDEFSNDTYRITAAWCQIHKVPIEKIFSKTLVKKCEQIYNYLLIKNLRYLFQSLGQCRWSRTGSSRISCGDGQLIFLGSLHRFYPDVCRSVDLLKVYNFKLYLSYDGCLERPNSHVQRINRLAPTATFTMSRFNDLTARPIFASKTTFDALTVDSGEESEETTEPETTTGRFVTQSFPKLSY